MQKTLSVRERPGFPHCLAFRFPSYPSFEATSKSPFGAEAPLKRSATIVIRVKVKPNSRISTLERAEGGIWLARLRYQPIDGKANEELIALVAQHFQCRKSTVSIKSGAAGRMKMVRIEAPTLSPQAI
jgi:hypothetical protein